MNDRNSWVQQKAILAKGSNAIEFVESIITDLEGHDLENQGDTLLELVSVLRADLVSEVQLAVNKRSCEIISGLLGAAEEKLPNDPLPPMLLATFHFYDCRDPVRAYPHALRAVDKAQRCHDMVRQTTGELIRLSIALNNYQAVESLLTFLLDYQPGEFSMEIPLESDFLARLPIDSVSSSVLGAYRTKVSAAAKR